MEIPNYYTTPLPIREMPDCVCQDLDGFIDYIGADCWALSTTENEITQTRFNTYTHDDPNGGFQTESPQYQSDQQYRRSIIDNPDLLFDEENDVWK